MAGITGVFGTQGNENLENMLQVINHRGPNLEDKHRDDNFCFGINGSKLFEDNKRIIALDGMIFNSETEKPEQFLSDMIDKKGLETTLKGLRGMFSSVIYDKEKKEIYIVRDSCGIKPMFYGIQNSGLFFGSEIKSLIAGNFQTELNVHSLSDFFIIGYHVGNSTLFQDIQQVSPGEYMIVTPNKITTNKYFDYNNSTKVYGDINANALAELLEKSVIERVNTDRRIPLMLSGGLDSSTLLHIIHDKFGPEKIQAFNFLESFSDEENPFVRKIAEDYEIPLSSILPEDPEYFLNNLDRYIYHNETITIASFELWCLSDKISENDDYAYCGQGPDEMFGGYKKHQYPMHYVKKIKGNLEKFKELFGNNFQNKELLEAYVRAFEVKNGTELTVGFDSCQELPNMELWVSDRAAMTNGMMFCAPFLDERILNFSVNVRPADKCDTETSKKIFRDAAKLLGVPNYLHERQKHYALNVTEGIDVALDYFSRYYGRKIESHKHYKLFANSEFSKKSVPLYLGIFDYLEHIFLDKTISNPLDFSIESYQPSKGTTRKHQKEYNTLSATKVEIS